MPCKKRINAKELCRIYRALQNNYAPKETVFSSKELDHIMKTNGVPRDLVSFMIDKGNTYFLRSKKRNAYFYQFPKIPVHETVIFTLLNEYYSKNKKEKKSFSFSVEEAISLLKQEGYRVYRDRGIDIQKLKAEMPEIYEKFVRIEEILMCEERRRNSAN